jgi:hypothetical protein
MYFWEFATKSPFVYLQSCSSVFFSARPRRPRRPCAELLLPPRCLPSRHVPPQHLRRRSPPRAGSPLASPCRAATARAATHPAGLPEPAPARPSLLLDPEHILKLPTHSLFLSHVCIPTTFSFPSSSPRRTSTAATAHRRQPPLLLLIPGLVLEQHHSNPLKLTSPPNFILRH